MASCLSMKYFNELFSSWAAFVKENEKSTLSFLLVTKQRTFSTQHARPLPVSSSPPSQTSLWCSLSTPSGSKWVRCAIENRSCGTPTSTLSVLLSAVIPGLGGKKDQADLSSNPPPHLPSHTNLGGSPTSRSGILSSVKLTEPTSPTVDSSRLEGTVTNAGTEREGHRESLRGKSHEKWAQHPDESDCQWNHLSNCPLQSWFPWGSVNAPSCLVHLPDRPKSGVIRMTLVYPMYSGIVQDSLISFLMGSAEILI